MKKISRKDKRKSFFINDCNAAIYKLMQELSNHGTEVEGILRISGSHKQIEALKKAALKGSTIDFSKYDIHAVAGALKQILRDLQEPLLLFSNYDHLITASHFDDIKKTLSVIRAIIRNLPPIHMDILESLVKLSIKIEKNKNLTKMTTHNLAIVLGPTLLRKETQSQDDMLRDSVDIIKIADHLITSYDYLFGNTDVVTIENPVRLNDDEVFKMKDSTGPEISEGDNKKAYLIRLESKAKELDHRLSKEVGDKVILQSLLMHQTEDSTQLKKDYEKLNSDFKAVKELEKNYVTEIAELKSQLVNLEAKESEINALKLKLRDSEKKAEEKEKDAVTYKKKAEDAEKEAILLKKNVEEKSKELDALKKASIDKNKSSDSLQKRIEDKDREINDLKKSLDSKSKAVEEHVLNSKKSTDELNKEKSERLTVSKENDSLLKQIKDLKLQVTNKDKEFSEMETKYKGEVLLLQNNSISSKTQVEKDVKSLRDENKSLQDKLKSSEQKSSEADKKLKQFDDENKRLSANIKDLEKKNAEFDSKVKDLTKKVAEFNNLDKKYQASVKEVDKLKLSLKENDEKSKLLSNQPNMEIEELKEQLFSYLVLSVKLDSIVSNQNISIDSQTILNEIKQKKIGWKEWPALIHQKMSSM